MTLRERTTPVVGFLVIGLHLRAVPGWRRLGTALTVAAPVTLLLYIGYNLSFSQSATAAGHGVAGLTQRVLFVEILAWLIVPGVHTPADHPDDLGPGGAGRCMPARAAMSAAEPSVRGAGGLPVGSTTWCDARNRCGSMRHREE